MKKEVEAFILVAMVLVIPVLMLEPGNLAVVNGISAHWKKEKIYDNSNNYVISGWILISLPLVPNDTDITKILKPQLQSKVVTIVWGYVGTPRTWQFLKLGTGGTTSGTLKTMTDGNAYWVYLNGFPPNSTIWVYGSVIAPAALPPSYSLLPGWNLVGYKPQPDENASKTVGSYLSSIDGKYDTNNVWIYNNLADTWIRANVNPINGTVIHPADGMWILITATSAVTLRP